MPSPVPRKLLGEQAECAFLAEAVRRGFIVSKPYGESAPYDFIVQSRCPGTRYRVLGASSLPTIRDPRPTTAPLLRIQVKSVGSRDSQGRYTVNTRRSFSRSYLPGELDFFACWIVPLDLWYVIPAPRVGAHKCVHLYPDVAGSAGQYENYREAWHLLF